MYMSLSKLWEIVKDREAWCPWGCKESDTTDPEQQHKSEKKEAMAQGSLWSWESNRKPSSLSTWFQKATPLREKNSEVNLPWTQIQFTSVAQSCLILCDPMNRSTPGLPVHHQLLESTQTHVHWIGDAIRPSHPLSSPSPPALDLSQHQGLFQWVSSLHQVAKVLEL